MRSMYQFLYDRKGRPIITICTLTLGTGGPFARGVAICSIQDIKAGTFCKKRGRVIAKGRALMALDKHESSCPIAIRGFMAADECIGFSQFRMHYTNKSMFDVILTDVEQEYFDDMEALRTGPRERLIPADIRV